MFLFHVSRFAWLSVTLCDCCMCNVNVPVIRWSIFQTIPNAFNKSCQICHRDQSNDFSAGELYSHSSKLHLKHTMCDKCHSRSFARTMWLWRVVQITLPWSSYPPCHPPCGRHNSAAMVLPPWEKPPRPDMTSRSSFKSSPRMAFYTN